MKIPIIFLGTAQAIPTARRNHTAVLLKYKEENILVDCGEGTQRQFRKAKINPCKLTRILITHWHGDHVLGLPGLLQTLAFSNFNKTLHIYGPKGTKRHMSFLYKIFVPEGKIKLEINEVSQGKIIETKDFIIEAFPLTHGTPTNAYTFTEKQKLRLDKNKIAKQKLPNTKILKQLQEGKSIIYKNKKITPKQVAYKQSAKKITFMFDTGLNKNLHKIAQDSDLLIAESTYAEKDKTRAGKNKHLTAKQAAQIAKKANAKKLLLTHISQRYQANEKPLLQEAKAIFKNTTLAEDLMGVEI